MRDVEPQDFDRVLSSMCTPPHPVAREAAIEFLDQNPGDPATYPGVAELEERAVAGLGEICGLSDPAGYIAGGGTEANIQAVRVARNRSVTHVPNVVAPESAHFSFQKAADLLGVELRLAALDEDYRVNLAAVREAVDEETALVVGVAGTTEYGRVDPIPELAEIADEADALCHVDAAWGGFLLPFTDHDWHFEHAPIDSVTIDPHKFGRAAIPAGGFLVREKRLLDSLAVDTPYLESRRQATLAGTRSGAGVASAAAAIEELWPTGYEADYERVVGNADWLTAQLRDRGIDVVEPVLPLVAADVPASTFSALREAGWRVSRTAAGELRVVMMPHVTREMLAAFLEDLDRLG